jgi:hypothetical protein
MAIIAHASRRFVSKPGAQPGLPKPAAPIVYFNPVTRLLTAVQPDYPAQMEYRHGQTDTPKPYAALLINDSLHVPNEWQFRVAASAGNLESNWTGNDLIEAKTVAAPATPGLDNDPSFALWLADTRIPGEIPYKAEDVYWTNNIHGGDFSPLVDGSTANYYGGGYSMQDAYSEANQVIKIELRKYRPKLSSIRANYRNAYGPITMYYYERGHFEPTLLGVVPNGAYQTDLVLPQPTDVVAVEYRCESSGADQLSELKLFGEYSTPRPFFSQTTPQASKYMIGANFFEWEVLKSDSPSELDLAKLEKMAYFHTGRHYNDYIHSEAEEGKYTFQPSSQQYGSWGYDVLQQWFKDALKDYWLCIKNTPPYVYNTWPAEISAGSENKFVVWQGNMADTVAYNKTPGAHLTSARNWFQWIARNGGVALDLSLVKPYTGANGTNQVKTGQGLIRHAELGNEKNSYWHGIQGYMNPYECAAQWSAEYDGHMNTMGPGVGIKNADPSVIVSAGGSAIRSREEMLAITDWCRKNRGYRADGSINLCFDVWNYHSYSNDGGSSQTGNITRGMAPEIAGAHLAFLDVKAFCDEYWNGCPIIMGEYGYDKSRYSTQRAVRPIDWLRDASGNIVVDQYGNLEPAAGDDNSVRQLVDAQWTSRQQEELGALGIFRMHYYMLNNASDPASPWSRYSDCGMFEPNGSPRIVARFMRQRLELQGEYVPLSHDFTPGADVWRVDKVLPGTSKQLTCFWVPKEQAGTGNFTFTVTAASTLVTLSANSNVPTKTVYQAGTYTVVATENPAYLMRNQVI